MSEIKLVAANSLKPGSYVLINEAPCVVKDISVSRPGKHGHAKVRIKAADIITGTTRELVKPGHDEVEVPIIKKKNGQILSISGNNIEFMDLESYETHIVDNKFVEENIKDKIKSGQTILFWEVQGYYLIKQIVSEE